MTANVRITAMAIIKIIIIIWSKREADNYTIIQIVLAKRCNKENLKPSYTD